MFRATVPATTVINRVSNFWPGHKLRVAKIAYFGHE